MMRATQASPRQNRVTPFGEILATPHRGTLMGNRGCLHDDDGRVVRDSQNRAWISCLTQWQGWQRQLMAPGSYTELFFLDEPTALAAGHRPCNTCRTEALTQFKQAWAIATSAKNLPRVAEMDAALRQQCGRLHAIDDLEALPDGAMITVGDTGGAWLRWEDSWWRWSFAGYQQERAVGEGDFLLITPPSIVAVLKAGYRMLEPTLELSRA